ncbi:NMT1/THI5 like-domain-containing protein [Phlyctochytrium arcticum]|nr:NMT1/THI5 like-domain-containing protein [Phlyctochytrium arcticum]
MHISGRNADFAAVKVAWTALLLLVLGNLNVVDAADCVVHDKVSFQLNWVWQAQFAGFQAASSLGYFGDECLNVQIRQGETTFNGLSEVSEGRAVFGNAWTSGVAAAHTMGENLTIVMQHFQRSGLRFLSKKRPDINEFTDLANKKVSTFIFNYIDLALTSSLAKYNVANVSVIPQSFTPFKLFSEDGTAVDAVSVMVYNELAQILEFRNPSTNALYRQDQMKIFDVNDLGTNMLEDNIFVRSDWLEKEENKNITRRFLRAVTKGWIYCRDHEDDCRNLLYDHGPHQQWMMREVNRLIWPSPLGFGMMDPDTLNRTVDVISTVVTGNRSSYPLSDNSYILWAKNSLQSSGWDVKGDGWTQPRLHFCMNSGEVLSPPAFRPTTAQVLIHCRH